MAAEDLTGRTFGKWTVLRKSKTRPYYFVCRCECGREKDVNATELRCGRTRSCVACANRKANPKLTQINIAKAKEKEGQTINGWYVVEVLPEKNGPDRLCRAICPVCGKEAKEKLRILPYLQKCANCNNVWLRTNGKVNKNSSSGVTGVSQLKDGRWTAYLNFRKRHFFLGEYKTLEEAVAIRKKAEELVYSPSREQHEGWEKELEKNLEALVKARK